MITKSKLELTPNNVKRWSFDDRNGMYRFVLTDHTICLCHMSKLSTPIFNLVVEG